MNTNDLTLDEKESLVYRKIKHLFNDSPEHKLYMAVVNQSVEDYVNALKAKEEVKGVLGVSATKRVARWRLWGLSAQMYLQGRMWHAELCGVDSGYIRFVMDKIGLPVDLSIE